MPMSEPPGTRRCRYCNARIVVLKDSAGKWQALDVRAPVYRVRTTPPPEVGLIAVRVADTYVSHWTTCTDRVHAKQNQTRKRNKKAREAAQGDPTDGTGSTTPAG